MTWIAWGPSPCDSCPPTSCQSFPTSKWRLSLLSLFHLRIKTEFGPTRLSERKKSHKVSVATLILLFRRPRSFHIYQLQPPQCKWRAREVRHISANDCWGHEFRQKLHSENEPPIEMQGICWKEETFPLVTYGKTIAGIILQICALLRLFRCQNYILILTYSRTKKKQALKQRKTFNLFSRVLHLEGCGRETLKLRENMTRENMAK